MKIKLKKIIESKVGNVFFSALRGLLRLNPGGNAVIDITQNIIAIIKNKKAENKEENKKELPHSWNAIVVEIMGIALISYAFYIKIITLEQLKSYVELILNNLE